MKKHHPDHQDGGAAGANERAQRLNAAYALIGSADKRRAYDLRAEAPPGPDPAARAAEPARQRRAPRVSVSRYFGRSREAGEDGRIGPAAVIVIAITLALLAFWLADVRRYWDESEPARAERR